MNSTYAKLVACDAAIRAAVDRPQSRVNDRMLRELIQVRNRVIRNAGPVEYGPNHPPRDGARWQMTKKEWEGQE